MILNYLLRLYTKQFVLFTNLLTGRTQKVRFFVTIKFILKTYIWLVYILLSPCCSTDSISYLHLLLWAFWNFGRFVIRRFLIGRFFCIGRCVALDVLLHGAFCFFWQFCFWVFCTHFVFLLVSSWVFLV